MYYQKEYLIVIFILVGIAVVAFRNWGKRFKFIGYTKYTEAVSSEGKCRVIFERIFKSPFPRVRPDFLRNPKSGRNLELDGYNKNIITPMGKGLAFEYNGEQHYFFTEKFHQHYSDFEQQQERDKLKVKLCKQAKVALIVIPYTIRSQDYSSFIVKRISELGLYYYLN